MRFYVIFLTFMVAYTCKCGKDEQCFRNFEELTPFEIEKNVGRDIIKVVWKSPEMLAAEEYQRSPEKGIQDCWNEYRNTEIFLFGLMEKNGSSPSPFQHSNQLSVTLLGKYDTISPTFLQEEMLYGGGPKIYIAGFANVKETWKYTLGIQGLIANSDMVNISLRELHTVKRGIERKLKCMKM